MSMSVLQYIKQFYPKAKIEWLVDRRFKEVLAYQKDLSAVHCLSLRDNKKNIFLSIYEVLKLKKKLGRFDMIIDMQGLMKSAVISKIIGKNVVGYDKESIKESLSSLFYTKGAHVSYSSHILKRNFELIKKGLKISASYDEIMHKKPYLYYEEPKEDFSSFLSTEQKNILFVIGGSWDSKIYPKEHVREVIDHLKQNALILWSNPDEYERAKWIVNQTSYAKMLPKMSFNDLKAVISKCDVIVGNDTGPCHMAWALNKPSVTILGCTSITRIPINKKNLAVTSDSCVNPSKIDKSDLSIQEISPHDVSQCVLKLI